MRSVLLRLVLFALCVLCAFCLFGCGSRWRANTPRTVALGSPTAAYETALTTLRAQGYQVVENDPQRGYIRAQAKLDGDTVGYVSGTTTRYGTTGAIHQETRISWLSFQVRPDGQLTVSASGYHVRDGDTVMHRRLAEEIDVLVGRMRSAPAPAHAPAPAATGGAPAASSDTSI